MASNSSIFRLLLLHLLLATCILGTYPLHGILKSPVKYYQLPYGGQSTQWIDSYQVSIYHTLVESGIYFTPRLLRLNIIIRILHAPAFMSQNKWTYEFKIFRVMLYFTEATGWGWNNNGTIRIYVILNNEMYAILVIYNWGYLQSHALRLIGVGSNR